MMDMTEETAADGNVFEDLGFNSVEAANLKVRAALMHELRRYVRDHELTQQNAADLMDVTQPRISDLMRGKIELFSIDALIGMLARIGLDVKIKVERTEA